MGIGVDDVVTVRSQPEQSKARGIRLFAGLKPVINSTFRYSQDFGSLSGSITKLTKQEMKRRKVTRDTAVHSSFYNWRILFAIVNSLHTFKSSLIVLFNSLC